MDSRDIFKGGHRTLHRGCIRGPTKVLIWDPCPSGLPEIAVVHMTERLDRLWAEVAIPRATRHRGGFLFFRDTILCSTLLYSTVLYYTILQGLFGVRFPRLAKRREQTAEVSQLEASPKHTWRFPRLTAHAFSWSWINALNRI